MAENDVNNLLSAAKSANNKGPPPVHLWNPPFCGDLDMRIARDGTWFDQGTPIGRPAMVRLFSSILRKDGDDYFLVTPVEKVGITVDDAPFVGVDFNQHGTGIEQVITLTNNVDETVTIGPDHPLRIELDSHTNEPAPYVLMRRNLEALVDRKSFYRLVELGTVETVDGEDWFGLYSAGEFFPFMRASELG